MRGAALMEVASQPEGAATRETPPAAPAAGAARGVTEARDAAAPAAAPPPTTPRGIRGWLRVLVSPFTNAAALRDAPSELWVCFWLQAIISLNYFTLTLVLTEYLSLEFGVSDVRAGLVYGLFGTLTSLYAFPTGILSDYIGIRWSLFIAACLNGAGRLALALTTNRATAVAMLYSVLPLANGIDWGILTTGVRRYAPARSRAVAFAVLASFLNLGQLLSGVVRDAFVLPAAANAQQQGLHREGAQLSVHVSGYRALLLFGAAASALELGLSGFASPGVAPGGGTPTLRARLRVPPRALLRDTLRSAAFWRFALLLILCSIVRMILQYVTAAMPKYLTRVFGPNVPVGALVAIQPALCVFLVPLVTAIAENVSPLRMIAAGAAVSTLALLWLVADVAIWAVAVFMVTLAVGEAMWSPRLFEFTAMVAPAGASCTWSAAAALPMFMAKLPTGLLSGALLETFCPAEGHRRPRLMWLVVFGVTALGPLAMFALHRVIAGPPLSAQEQAARKAAAAAAAPAETAAPAPFGSGAEPVELAEAWLHGEFDDVDEVQLLPTQHTRRNAAAAEDPQNPFRVGA